MVFDTAFYRYKFYHKSGDTPDRLCPESGCFPWPLVRRRCNTSHVEADIRSLLPVCPGDPRKLTRSTVVALLGARAVRLHILREHGRIDRPSLTHCSPDIKAGEGGKGLGSVRLTLRGGKR